MKVMIVDDDTLVTQLLQELLIDWEYEPVIFNKGAEALVYLSQHGAPDVAILDWNIPLVSGLHLCQAIRKLASSTTAIIMLTSNSESRHVIKALAAGADSYIVKPFEPEDLKTRIENCVAAIKESASAA